ncbi:MAG: glycosyltransferase family 2 protein [Calditrichales bacterium]|nr:glycosyltransferase family 2 protein [Calditrichales bacterium]
MINKLSVVIITQNEEKNIERCLKSVQWADEIVIIDSGSTDATLEICRRFNCKIIQTEWLGFGLTKRLAVDSATHDWILSLDADEEVTKELKEKTIEILKDPKFDGYSIKRKSFYLGKMIKHCGWNNDYPMRLFNRMKGNFNDKEVHEKVVVNGKKTTIEEYFLHYTYPTIGSHINKMHKYALLGAKELKKKNKKATIIGAIFRSWMKFLKMYFLRRGFLDGKIGFILSCNSAFGVYLKYLKLWEKDFSAKHTKKILNNGML